jgi:DNA-binding NarL/FixJ family response regulator
LDQLTERQRSVALLVADGLTNDEIAVRLYVSQATVKSHVTAILQRLDIRSRINLVILINHDRVRRA